MAFINILALRCGVYSRAAFIRGQRLLEKIRYVTEASLLLEMLSTIISDVVRLRKGKLRRRLRKGKKRMKEENAFVYCYALVKIPTFGCICWIHP